MDMVIIAVAVLAVIGFGTWFASSLTYFLAPQSQEERDKDDADQLAYLEAYTKKHKEA